MAFEVYPVGVRRGPLVVSVVAGELRVLRRGRSGERLQGEALTLSREQVFRLQRPLATFLGLVAGFAIGALLVIAIYYAWVGSSDLELPTPDSSPFLLKPHYLFGFIAALLGLYVWGSLWAIPFEIRIDREERIRILTPLRERVYGRQEIVGMVKVLLVCHRLAAQDDSFLLLPEFSRHEALFTILQRRTAEAKETGDA